MAAGLTVTALARQIGAPVQTVSRWEHGGNRPPWQFMPKPKLADIFCVRSEELVERLWGEKVGDPCPKPHDCNGKKILPDEPLVLQTLNPGLRRDIPGALKLLIKVSCAGSGCGRECVYTPSQPHPKFCAD